MVSPRSVASAAVSVMTLPLPPPSMIAPGAPSSVTRGVAMVTPPA